MFAKPTTQVNILFIIPLTLLILTAISSPLLASPECQESWQPNNPRTCCDDLFYKDLAQILTANIKMLKQRSPQSMAVCNQTITSHAIIESYTKLATYISHHSAPQISAYIHSNFNFCPPTKVLITGYYEPVIPASLRPAEDFPIPLYTAPKTEPNQTKFTAPRATIENSTLLKGHELVYVRDAFTAFTIHVQGSALLTFNNGSKRQVHYQRSNGKPYSSVGRILIEQREISREDMSMHAIKQFTQQYPQKTKNLLQTNERFIYFTMGEPVTEPEPPPGSFNIPLTPRRSIALDPESYPPGLLFHLQGTLPVISPTPKDSPLQFHRRSFSRFMLNQDSGSAIKGPTRVDIFMGRGTTAQTMAGEMQENGCLRVLLPK